MPVPVALRVEHHLAGDVLGLGTPSPRLSWRYDTAPASFGQVAYEVEVVRAGLSERYEVPSSEQVLVAWPSAPLGSREAVTVRVRVHDEIGRASCRERV